MKPMPRLAAFLILAFLLLAACQPGPHKAQAPTPPPLLILISIDGYRADYFDLGLTPALAELSKDGVRARAMRPSFPSLTFPNHYTLVTGLRPNHHGVVHNTMRDPELPGETFTLSNRKAVGDARWWDDGEPIWNSASRAGLRSATMFWPGSEAPIHGQHPDYWRPFDISVSSEARVAQVLEWLDLPPDERPDFITLYFDVVDSKGHRYGPDAPETHAVLVEVDTALATLVQGLRKRGLFDATNLVIVSDHGMTPTPEGHTVAMDEVLPAELFDLNNIGPLASLDATPGNEEALDAALASTPIPHAQCWRKDRLPERFHYGSHRRISRWLCQADEGWLLASRAIISDMIVPKGYKGAHGFDNTLPSMAALFLAHGPDFRKGLIVDELDNVDVYPLLARLLHIAPEPNDGDPEATVPMLSHRTR